jgi:hypothetical protein
LVVATSNFSTQPALFTVLVIIHNNAQLMGEVARGDWALSGFDDVRTCRGFHPLLEYSFHLFL